MRKTIIRETRDENEARSFVRALRLSGVDVSLVLEVGDAALPGVVGFPVGVWQVSVSFEELARAERLLARIPSGGFTDIRE